jgi:hypothetical protein
MAITSCGFTPASRAYRTTWTAYRAGSCGSSSAVGPAFPESDAVEPELDGEGGCAPPVPGRAEHPLSSNAAANAAAAANNAVAGRRIVTSCPADATGPPYRRRG